MATKQNNGYLAPDGSTYVTISDGAGSLSGVGANGLPPGATSVTSSSGNIAAGTATATLAAAANKTTYIVGAIITGSGATLASAVNGTITGLPGGTMTFTVPVTAGILLGNPPLFLNFYPAIPASAVNTAIVVSVPTLGAGNTNSAVSAWGYQL